MDSVAFDRASDFYDATRSLPPEVASEVLSILESELSGRRGCLEIGVGTGRFSLPLHARGVDVVGADLSRPMLSKLVAKADGAVPFPLCVADATVLPYRAASLDAVLACHVLHLVPEWRRAVDEALRVLRPGAVLLVDHGGHDDGPWEGEAMRLMALHGVVRVRPGLTDPDEMEEFVGARAARRALPAVTMKVRRSLAQDLDQWERQIFAWTWPYTPEQMAAGCADVREWAAAGGWPIDQAVTIDSVIRWWAYDLPD